MKIVRFLAAVAVFMLKAYTLMKLWGWFVVDILDVNTLTFNTSVGLILVFSVVKMNINRAELNAMIQDADNEDDEWKSITSCSFVVAGLLLSLFVGYMFEFVLP
jgi:sensor histidine kinase YesM